MEITRKEVYEWADGTVVTSRGEERTSGQLATAPLFRSSQCPSVRLAQRVSQKARFRFARGLPRVSTQDCLVTSYRSRALEDKDACGWGAGLLLNSELWSWCRYFQRQVLVPGFGRIGLKDSGTRFAKWC